MLGAELSGFYAQLLAVVVGLALALDLRHDLLRIVSARNVVLCGYLSWYLLEALIIPEALNLGYTQSEYDFGVFLLGLSITCFLLGYHKLPPTRAIDSMAIRLSLLEQPRHLWAVTVSAALIGLAPVLYYGGLNLIDTVRGFMGMHRSWGGGIGRAQFGQVRDAMLMLELFLIGLAGLATVYALRRDEPAWKRTFAALVVTYAVLRAYGTGTRSSLLITAIPIAMAVVWRLPLHYRRRLILLMVPLGFLFYEYSIAVVAGRERGILAWGAETQYVGFEMFRELLFITKYFPGSYEFVWGQSYIAELVNPIPRFLWESKPPRFGVTYAAIVAPGSVGTGYTAAYGIVGEMYMNFGIVGILLVSTVGGWICRTWDRLGEVAFQYITVMTFYAMGLAGFFVIGRSFTFPVFYQAIFVFLAVIVVTQREYTQHLAASRAGGEIAPQRS